MNYKNDLENYQESKIERIMGSWQFLVVTGIIAIILPLLLMAAFYITEHKDHTFSESIFRFTLDKYNFGTVIIGFVLLAFIIFLWVFAYNKKSFRNLLKQSDAIKEGFEQYLKSSKIVFESGINEFDDKHLLALQRVLNALGEDVTEIYAIDNSDPVQWWSDTMIGYLALLSKWKSLDNSNNRRNVSRIFVCDINELLSPVLAKTITLHSLMGFNTYIYSKNMFEDIFIDLKQKNNFIIEEKEVLIWNSPVKNKINFELNEKKWFNVNCYQSFWNIWSNKYERPPEDKTKDPGWKNYYGDNIKLNDISILFEFVAHEDKPDSQNGLQRKKLEYWEKIPIQYMLLIDTLIKNTYCCKNENEVKIIEEKTAFGVEIKTRNCNICKKECKHGSESSSERFFDFTRGAEIKRILEEYYKKNIVGY